ncbi:MAG: PDZ domain-containing protein [Chloroflexi bacterium]|nr:PDZ domain-containing protein [Chloroflexota bacterium]
MTTADMNALQQLSDGLAAAAERAQTYTVRVRARRRLAASGVAWANGGYIVSADHALEQEDAICVGLPDGQEVVAQLVGRDPGSDLALLRVEGAAPAAAEFAPAGAARVGQLVLASGRPWGDGVHASGGVVSAVGGPLRTRRGTHIEGYLRSDVTLQPGFSGGSLIDVAGRVLGVNTSRGGRGEGATIAAHAVSALVAELREHGHVRRAYLGVGSQPVALPASLATTTGDQTSGLVAVSVEAGCRWPSAPARSASDILLALGGDVTTDVADLQAQLGAERVGATVPLVLLRGGERREFSVTLGERA